MATRRKKPEVVRVSGLIRRDADGIACPKCNGYADQVDPTREEVEKYNCMRAYSCCVRVFVCRLCKTRLAGQAAAPDWG